VSSDVPLHAIKPYFTNKNRELSAVLVFRHEDDSAWPILATFFRASGGRLAPQKRIADDEARNR
jgi:hypothetical protein